jgi:hypothetical protein
MGTWREGYLSGDPEKYLGKALGTGISLYRGSTFWESGEGLVYRGL